MAASSEHTKRPCARPPVKPPALQTFSMSAAGPFSNLMPAQPRPHDIYCENHCRQLCKMTGKPRTREAERAQTIDSAAGIDRQADQWVACRKMGVPHEWGY